MTRRRPKSRLSLKAAAIRAAVHGAVAVSVTIVGASGAHAQSMKVSATDFTDVNFGTVLNFQTTTRRAQSLCVYANSNGSNYSVSAAGGGPGGSFVLYDGSRTLTYGVEWAASAGRSSGTPVTANALLTGQHSTANNQNCNGPGGTSTATLVIALRPSDLDAAISGNYSGTLFVTVSPE